MIIAGAARRVAPRLLVVRMDPANVQAASMVNSIQPILLGIVSITPPA